MIGKIIPHTGKGSSPVSPKKFSIGVKITRSDAINDLHNRVNPENARYHKTHHFPMHLVYTIAIVLIYFLIALPLGISIFSLFIGFFNALIIGLLGLVIVGPGFFLFMRHRYYKDLKLKTKHWYAVVPIVIGLVFLGAYALFGLPLTMAIIYLLQSKHLTQAGLYAGLAVWMLGGATILAGLLFYRKSSCFSKEKTKGIHLGTAFQHYINTLHYDAIGTMDSPKDTPLMVGETKEFVIDYLGEPNPHAIILGGSGSGKTITLRAFLIRALLEYDLKFLIIDWNGESEEWAKKINATVWKAGKHFKINPFLLRGASVADRAGNIAELFQFGANLTPLQSNLIRTIALEQYQYGDTPTLMSIWKEINRTINDRGQTSQKREYAEWVDQRLRIVQRVFGKEPEEFWKGILARNNIISLAGLNENEKSIVAYAVFQRVVEFFNGKPEKQRLMVVLDEARAALHSQRYGDQLYESLPCRIVRLGRKYGFGMIVSTQQVEDIPRPFINSSAIRILHSYRDKNFLDGAKKVFGLGDFESAYLGTAGIGEGFVFDQARAAAGQSFGDYVKIRMVEDSELKQVKEQEKVYAPKILDEPELPIDLGGTAVEETKRLHWPPPKDRPTPMQYIGLLAIYRNPGKLKAELVKIIRNGGIVRNTRTIYGSRGKPGILRALTRLKLAEEKNEKFFLTEKGMKWTDPSMLLEPDKTRIGSTMHERILIQTIKELQDKHMLVVVPGPEKIGDLSDCIDLIAYPIDEKRKYLWDDSKRKGYEIQTAARKEGVLRHAKNADKYGVPLTWVSWDPDVLHAIREMRGDKDEYMVVEI